MTLRPENFWQDFSDDDQEPSSDDASDSWPVRLPNDRRLLLPVRRLAGGEHGLASLIINQAAFGVQRELCGALAEALRPFAPEVIVGLPTLGLTVASAVAERLGHSRYVPLGTSRKFWYDEALSVEISSVTTSALRRLYIDPRLVPLLSGRRVVLIDDVLSTGRSIVGGLELLGRIGVVPVAVGAVMLQTNRWRAALGAAAPPVVGVFETPLLGSDGEAWRALPG